jgi:nucleoside phosphorylase/CheY-like chemotaxis protein
VRILLVDDSVYKVEHVIALVRKVLPDVGVDIDVANDAATAARFLKTTTYNLLILDVNLPLRAGERTSSEGGVVILDAISDRKQYRRPEHIVGLSEYSDLVLRYKHKFSSEMWHLIPYATDNDEWAQQLGRKLIHIAEIGIEGEEGFLTDLGIVTALHPVELEAVLALPAKWTLQRFEDDDSAYYHGSFETESGSMSVVAAAAVEMGMPAATAMSMKMIYRFRPRFLAMVGIAAGVKGQFGDILIADQVWDYGSGKAKHEEGSNIFMPAPSSIPLSPYLKSKFQVFGLQRKPLRAIQLDWEGPEAHGAPLQAFVGPVASGAAVIADRSVVEDLVSRNRKLIGVEMEAYGVFVAAQQASRPRPLPMVIKSICDFGNAGKADEYQQYAAFTSARYLYEFARSELIFVRGKTIP